jgi:hypothetical protein
MNPALMFIVAITLPTLFLALLIGPIYLGMCGSVYIYYDMKDWKEYIYNPDYVIGIHQGLYQYWEAHKSQLGIMDFIVPAWGPVALGVLGSCWLLYRFGKYLSNIFKIQADLS